MEIEKCKKEDACSWNATTQKCVETGNSSDVDGDDDNNDVYDDDKDDVDENDDGAEVDDDVDDKDDGVEVDDDKDDDA
jgi:hypothetical protein